jgi:thiol:disulfide interchange protein DsbA
VIEFFWYGCDHCYRLEPAIEAWLPKSRKEVAFRRIPAIASGAWAAHAQIHYTLEAIGRLEDLHPRIFEAIHKEGLRLEQPAVLARWLAAQGVDMERYAEAGKSFGVLAKMKQAEELTRAYRLEGVPMIVVNGRYATNPAQAGGAAKMFQVIDHLVARERWK